MEPFSLPPIENISDQNRVAAPVPFSLNFVAPYFLSEKMKGEVVQEDDFYWISQKNPCFLGGIEPDLIYFGKQINTMFLIPHGIIQTIMNGWNAHDFLSVFPQSTQGISPLKMYIFFQHANCQSI